MKEFLEKIRFIRNNANNGWCYISGIDLTKIMRIIKEQEEELTKLRASQDNQPLPKGVITP